ncbi:MAG: hypothetical protein Q4G49_07420 [Paracoccus sp. (in: a-proteobacteria)]|nr:hypothetical protein [Paracoccus sp. (in: a-proteobacteria)]
MSTRMPKDGQRERIGPVLLGRSGDLGRSDVDKRVFLDAAIWRAREASAGLAQKRFIHQQDRWSGGADALLRAGSTRF